MPSKRARRSVLLSALKAIAVTLAVVGPRSATALDFKEITTPDQAKVLLLYDCESGTRADGTSKTCEPYETQFSGETHGKNGATYPGDAAVLDQILTQHHEVSRVWLASGGGDLEEGLKLGRVLRAHQQYVYVPAEVFCASSCTVAFLGGVMREVDPKAAFLVHAPSAFLEPAPRLLHALASPDGELELKDVVDAISERARRGTGELFAYVQAMIGGRPKERAIATTLDHASSFAEAYRISGALKADAQAVHREGEIWAHDLLMRLEREAAEHYLGALEEAARQSAASDQPALGERAIQALRIVENMYRSRITGTFQLDQTTLREMGYTNVKD